MPGCVHRQVGPLHPVLQRTAWRMPAHGRALESALQSCPAPAHMLHAPPSSLQPAGRARLLVWIRLYEGARTCSTATCQCIEQHPPPTTSFHTSCQHYYSACSTITAFQAEDLGCCRELHRPIPHCQYLPISMPRCRCVVLSTSCGAYAAAASASRSPISSWLMPPALLLLWSCDWPLPRKGMGMEALAGAFHATHPATALECSPIHLHPNAIEMEHITACQ